MCNLETYLRDFIEGDWCIVPWLVHHAGNLISWFRRDVYGKTPYEKIHGRKFNCKLAAIGESVWALLPDSKDSNKLEGVITDGDLRRLLERENDPMSLIAKDVMTRDPKVIEKNALASEALRIFEIKKINHLIVVDDQSLPIGAIGFHELASAKIL